MAFKSLGYITIWEKEQEAEQNLLFLVRNKEENEYTLVPACPKINWKLGVLGWYLISALKGQRQGYCFRSEGEAEIDRRLKHVNSRLAWFI